MNKPAPPTAALPIADCAECGMPCTTGEYHPYAACLMFKACHDSGVVRANLAAVRAPAVQATADVDGLAREICARLFLMTPMAGTIATISEVIRKAASLKDAADWQPIETAPKDGTSILVCGGIYWNDEGGAAIGDHEYPLGVEIACWYKDEWYLGYGEGYNDEKWAKPKYWMPKPAAVSGDKQEKERG